MTTLDRAIPVTFFEDYAAQTKREEPYSPRALAERISTVTMRQKARLPWLKLARFGEKRSPPKADGTGGNSLRWDVNVLEVTGIEADYDQERIPFDAAMERLEKQGIASILYTSPSYTEDTPRWRVLCPLSEELAPDRRRAIFGRLNGLFGGVFSRESWTLSQAYYFGSVNHNPSHRVELIDGTTIDQHDDLDEIWLGPSAQAQPDQTETGRDERETAELIRRALTGEELHTTLVPLAARLIGRNISQDITTEILRGIMRSWPEAAQDDRWRARYAEIGRIVTSATTKYREPAEQRGENTRAIARLAGRMIRERQTKDDIRAAVAEEAIKLNIDPARAQQIATWVGDRELDRRKRIHAQR